MKILTCSCAAGVSALLLFSLAGCTSEQRAMRGSSNTSATGAGIGMMDSEMAAMCHEMYQEMAAARTPEQRQAIMRERMEPMSPEMRRSMHRNIGAYRCH